MTLRKTSECPDGYIAWHDQEKFLDGEERLYDTFERAEDILIDVFGHGYGARGWRIRPIKFQFLDEGENER